LSSTRFRTGGENQRLPGRPQKRLAFKGEQFPGHKGTLLKQPGRERVKKKDAAGVVCFDHSHFIARSFRGVQKSPEGGFSPKKAEKRGAPERGKTQSNGKVG